MAQPASRHEDYEDEFENVMMKILQVDDLQNFRLFRKVKEHARLMAQITGAGTEEGRLTTARMRLLMRLVIDVQQGGDGLSPSDLSRFLDVSRNTVSALLNRLEEQGLVERHVHPGDRRQFRIHLTQAGRAAFEAHAPHFAAFLKHVYAPLTPDERHTLFDLLTKLNAGLKETARGDRLPLPADEPAS